MIAWRRSGRSSVRAVLLAAALAALLTGCERTVPPYVPPVVEVQGVRQVFALPRRGGIEALVATLRGFAEGRMDALHMTLPPGQAMDRLAGQLVLDGVLPRKIRRDGQLAPGTIAATRYVAFVAPCPALDLRGGAFSRNGTRPGFGCATLADFAAQASDPADLLGNDATPSPDPERAALPVARWRGFAAGGGAGGGPSLPTGGPQGLGATAAH